MSRLRPVVRLLQAALCAGLLVAPSLAASAAVQKAAVRREPDRSAREGDADAQQPAFLRNPSLTIVPGTSLPVRSAVVNLTLLARQAAALRLTTPAPPVRVLPTDQDNQSIIEPTGMGAPPVGELIKPPVQPFVLSPSPASSYQGLDDVPMVDSSYIIIPPDVAGGVGPSKVMESFNNNYRIRDKATGATLLTVGTATFWNPVVTDKRLLNGLTDPRTTYDPIQGRWIVAMQTTNNPGLILFGVSQTSDPQGSWFLYSIAPGFSSAPLLDFPILGFNKNWLVVSINAYTAGGSFREGGTLIASYPDAAAGTLTSVSAVTQASGTHFCAAPCVTISATEDTLFLVTHLSSAGATYEVDRITGTPSAPVYTSGTAQTRPGGGWVQPSGNQLPQGAPNAGSAACSPPCLIETQDSQVRSAPMYRVDATTGRGYIYYTQSVGLPSSGQTHIGAQWTKITPSITPAFADGGRIEDATATATNGGEWYCYPHIAVNSLGDFVVGYSQFSSAQHPSAGYSYHDHTDGLGTLRDPFIYKAGEDYYHKTFTTTTGRNRWGDFSTAQVDPSDDKTLWVLQEYAKNRTSTNDGNTGTNGSRWSSYWASVAAQSAVTFTINASAGANGTISPSGAVVVSQGASQGFTITPNACYHVADVQVDAASVGAVTSYTFTNVQANHTISASFALTSYTITASAGSNGGISPSGSVPVNCGAAKGFSITPNACYHVADVQVDAASVGAVTSYNFPNVQANHTIAASFAINTYTITASAGSNGGISPSGSVPVNCGAAQGFTITPNACYHVADVQVDAASVGAVTSYNFTNVQANHTIAASFAVDTYTITASAGAGGSVSPSGAVQVNCGGDQKITISPDVCQHVADVLVDGSSVGAVTTYTFHAVGAAHTIAASFAPDSFTIAITIVGQGSVAKSPDQAHYACGSAVSLTATPTNGFGFVGWTGDVTSSTNPLGLNISGNVTLTATFADSTSPVVQVTGPPGASDQPIGSSATLSWTATDNVGVTAVDLLLSRSGVGGPYDSVAVGVPNTGSYSWLVTGPPTTDAFLQVIAHDAAGMTGYDVSDTAFTISGGAGVGPQTIVDFALERVTPHPVVGTAHIRFAVPREAPIRISVHDVQGREVAVLADGTFPAGMHEVAWSSSQTPPGLYFLAMKTPGRTLMERVVRVR